MSFLLKKVIRPWNIGKDTSHLTAPETPVSPPSPDLSHLTPDEINVIHDVIRRQEEFDRQEEDRVKKLRKEIESLQHQLTQKSIARTQSKKLVDLRLCRLCFKTKFADGVGRVCYDCQQRVCLGCGAFSKTRWNARKNKTVRGRWRCKLCMARREVLCRTGGWYHGTTDLSEELKKKLSVAVDPDAENDPWNGEFQVNHLNMETNECNPSGNQTDSELVWNTVGNKSPRKLMMTQGCRRRSLPVDSGGRGDDDGSSIDYDDDDDKDDKECFNSLILERRLSRRKRQEKRQRRRMRAGQEQINSESPTLRSKSVSAEDSNCTPMQVSGLPGRGQRRDSVTRSLWGPSSSLNSCGRKPTMVEECKADSTDSDETHSSIFSSYRDSSLSDEFPVSPSPTMQSLKMFRQDAMSLHSSCVSITSTSESRLGERSKGYLSSSDIASERSRESLITRSPMGQEVKKSPTKTPDKPSPKAAEEKLLQKWKQTGFPNACLISLSVHSKERPSLKVTGGVEARTGVSRALVTWVSADIRSPVSVGSEVLEWNGQTVRGQTYDVVASATSCVYPQTILVLNPTPQSEEIQPSRDGPRVITPDQPYNHQSPELQSKSGKRRILPRTPVEIKRGTHRISGEIQIKLFYQPSSSALAVTVLRARNITSASHTESSSPSPFVVISLVPGKSGRDSLETELRTSTSHPEWEHTFLLDGISLTELVSKALQLTVWSYEEGYDMFIGEVLLDLAQAHLNNQSQWYSLDEHDDNSARLPRRRGSNSASMSASWTSGSSARISPSVSPEVPSHRHYRYSPSSAGSTNVSPVPFANSLVGSREFHLNSVSQPDSFTTKVKKKMRNTVCKMPSLSLIEKKENAGSDESSHGEVLRRLSDKSDRSISLSKSPKLQMRAQSSHHSMDLLAPPQPLSRTNSSSSFFLSDEEESQGRYSVSPLNPDRPPPEGDDITSILGPGQIPPKPSAETTVCGDIKLGFMVSKGQLEVDIICAAGLQRAASVHPPDTYVKTYLVEGKKVIQRKKTLVVKSSYDPVYRKKIKYSACNVHGRTMKIDVWERTGSFEKKACRGEVLVRLDGLDLSKHTMSWYKLFQINSTDYGSDEFLNSW